MLPLPSAEALRAIDHRGQATQTTPVSQVARCRLCGILMGRDHVETQGRDGLCSSCWREEHRG